MKFTRECARMNTCIKIILIIALTGCRAPPAFERTELFFGLNRAGADVISENEWRAFVDDVVTPRFPDGLTIVNASGQWRNPSWAIESEPARILILLHTSTPKND